MLPPVQKLPRWLENRRHSRYQQKVRRLLVSIVLVACGLGAFSAHAVTPQQRQDQVARIVGGKPSPSGRWPSMVALVDRGSNLFDGQFCGGTIIARYWVLTAAHCVEGLSASNLQVATGFTDLNGPATEIINISQIIRHPNYNRITLNNDFALLRLQTATTQPRASLYSGNAGLSGLTGTAVGWGATNPSATRFDNNLMEVDLPVVSNQVCEDTTGDDITDQMICAGDRSGLRDACGGDSGGPLFATVSGRTLQIGVTSFGFGQCANRDVYGVWARISSATGFIVGHVSGVVLLDERRIKARNAVTAPVSLVLGEE